MSPHDTTSTPSSLGGSAQTSTAANGGLPNVHDAANGSNAASSLDHQLVDRTSTHETSTYSARHAPYELEQPQEDLPVYQKRRTSPNAAPRSNADSSTSTQEPPPNYEASRRQVPSSRDARRTSELSEYDPDRKPPLDRSQSNTSFQTGDRADGPASDRGISLVSAAEDPIVKATQWGNWAELEWTCRQPSVDPIHLFNLVYAYMYDHKAKISDEGFMTAVEILMAAESNLDPQTALACRYVPRRSRSVSTVATRYETRKSRVDVLTAKDLADRIYNRNNRDRHIAIRFMCIFMVYRDTALGCSRGERGASRGASLDEPPRYQQMGST